MRLFLVVRIVEVSQKERLSGWENGKVKVKSKGPSIKEVRKNLPHFDPLPPSSGGVQNH